MNADRGAIYARLSRRNRIVGWLRIGVPILGALVLAVLVGEIVIANLAQNFGASSVRIAKDRLIIDTPQYSGVMTNGTKYTITAKAAETVPGTPDTLALSDTRLDLVRTDGYEMRVTAEAAEFSMSAQTVHVAGVAHVTDSRGMTADLNDSTIDWTAQTLLTRGDVYVVFGDGSVLRAEGLRYDAGTEIWDFKQSELVVPQPESESR